MDKIVVTTKNRKKIQYGKTVTGFTLIEILIVITLLAVLAGFGLAVSLDSYREFTFRSQQELLVSLLQTARGQAMGNVNQSAHGLHIDSTTATYTLFQGDNFSRRDASQDLIFAGNPSQFFTGLAEVVFSRLSGTTTSGSIILNEATYPQAAISLNDEGQINSQ